MKIISLKAENIKRLRTIEIQADGKPVILAGPNGSGKSSTLDAIWGALQFGRATKAVDHPIRTGEESATAIIDLGDYVVKRRWTESGSTITVADANGRKYTSPQAILDKLIGNLAFDPLEFSRMGSEQQAKTLTELAKLDLSTFDEQHKALYDSRTESNRKVKDLIAQGKALQKPEEDWPDTEVSASALLDKIRFARRDEDLKKTYYYEIATLKADIAKIRDEVRRLQERESAFQSKLNFMQEEENRPENQPDRYDGPALALLETSLTGLEELNRKARAKIAHKAKLAEYQAAEAEAKKIQGELDANQQARAQAIAGAKYPIPGLAIDPEKMTVVFGGQSWTDMSTGERIKVSVAMAMAMNPSLRVLFVRDASLLDKKNLETILAMAESNDYQVWIEVVESKDPTAIQFLDGSIAN